MSEVTTNEWCTVLAARELAGVRLVFAGQGLPTLAVALANRTVAPDCEVVYESGVVGAHPESLPMSIADSVLVSGAEAIVSMAHMFGGILARGRVEVGFLGGAQIDRRGSLNSTLIGSDWEKPEARLPGSGGACEVMAYAREVFVVMRRHSPRTFVEELDFVTSPSPAVGVGDSLARPGGSGVTRVVSELGVLRRIDDELTLTHVRPGVTPSQVRAATGWDLRVADDVEALEPPTQEELGRLRALDPGRVYLR